MISNLVVQWGHRIMNNLPEYLLFYVPVFIGMGVAIVLLLSISED